MSRLSADEVLAEFRERTESGQIDWEYAGNRWDYAYRLAFPDLCFVIRMGLVGKNVIVVLKMMDSSGETLGLVAGDSDDPDSPHYSVLGDIFLSARHQAGNPFMEEVLESMR